MTDQTVYKIIYTIPPSHLAATKSAIFSAGGGTYAEEKYINVCFETPGYGEFKPVSSAGAVPHTGTVDQLARVEEVRVEIRCKGKEVTRGALKALKKAHPYEEVGYDKIEDF
jgi:hypothetical protein